MTDLPTPTPAELTLLTVLWRQGPSTVHDLLAALPERDVGYTTVLKTLQIMDAKGLVTRDAARRPHVFAAAIEEAATQRSLVRRLMDRAFQGSSGALALRALSMQTASRAELAELRALLERLEAAQEDGETPR